jgi:hypothetical protein
MRPIRRWICQLLGRKRDSVSMEDREALHSAATDSDKQRPMPAAAHVSFIDGGEIAIEVLQAIGYRTTLRSATIVSYNMQDYDFWGNGRLSHLLMRQLAFGASIRLVTTPPPGTPAKATFRSKYSLLSTLDKNGVQVFLNEKLHAKAYLFLDSTDTTTTIVGSANLTESGFGMTLTSLESLVELAMLSSDSPTLDKALEFVGTKILADPRTEDFATWFSRNSAEIGKAGL